MNGPRITADERGFTVNRTFAWGALATLVVGFGIAGVSVVYEAGRMADRLAQVVEDSSNADRERDSIRQRLSGLELREQAASRDFANLREDVSRIRDTQEQTNALLSELIRRMDRAEASQQRP